MKVAREAEERQKMLDFATLHGIALDEQRAARAVSAGRTEEMWQRLRASAGVTSAGAGAT